MAKTRSPKPAAAKKPMSKPPVEQATFKYVFEDTYNPIYANGAHGGPTPHGEIAINFFFERNPVPLSETFAVSPDGRVTETLAREPALSPGTIEIIRYVSTGVIMSRETAKRVYDFLGRQLQALDAVTEAKRGMEKIAADATASEKSQSPRGPRLGAKKE
jgi:hypothetical protein